jgi:hypothetical protein
VAEPPSEGRPALHQGRNHSEIADVWSHAGVDKDPSIWLFDLEEHDPSENQALTREETTLVGRSSSTFSLMLMKFSS